VQKIEILKIYIPFRDTVRSGFGSAIGVSMRNFVGLFRSARDLCLSLSDLLDRYSCISAVYVSDSDSDGP
jgi:hypothetical protein